MNNRDMPSAERKPPAKLVAGLLVAGLLGHIVAAHLNGGSRIAYVHHILGFFLIAAITGLPVAAFVWFRRQHRNGALIAFGLIQVAFGILVIVTEVGAR